MKNKIVLVIAYYFPPYKPVSGVRSAKFAKYLPTNGWTPWVMTVDPRYYGDRQLENDPRLQNELAGTHIIHTPFWSFPGHVLVMKILYPFFALGFAWKHRHVLDAVYLCGSPYHPFLLTIPLTGLIGIPSILDFRDSWSINHGFDGKKPVSFGARFREILSGAIECLSIRSASRVIFSTRKVQAEYTDLHPKWQWKYSTIHNGFDSQDFEHIKPRRTRNGRTIVIAGKFSIYTPDALAVLIQCLHELEDLHLIYMGEEQKLFNKAAMRIGISSRIQTLPYMPYTEALSWIARADIGIVSTGLVNGLGTKIFDYLALGKPVVCLVPEGSVIASEFAKTPQVIVSHPPHTTRTINRALQKAFKFVGCKPPADLKRFSRAESCSQLGRLLDNITQKNDTEKSMKVSFF
jgi:glycosyltransferase involved in cell wall biosynthesis